MSKIAVVINGDTHRKSVEKHQKNADRALKVLEGMGYETFVANPKKPNADFDHYYHADVDGVDDLIDDLKQKLDADDELCIYVTGHGNKSGFCLGDDCRTSDLIARFDALPFAKRTVVMDQCKGGNWLNRFVDDPRTLFISNGSSDEIVCCGEFAPVFWGEWITDRNHDGVISFGERYAQVLEHGVKHSFPLKNLSAGYVDDGTRPFEQKVVTVDTPAEMDAQLERLMPGQLAIVMFSMKGCPHCDRLQPKFEKLVKQAKGQYLILYTKNIEMAMERYGVTGFPQVSALDHKGGALQLRQYDDMLGELARAVMPREERIALLRARIDSEAGSDVYVALCKRLSQEQLATEAKTLRTLSLSDPKMEEGGEFIWSAYVKVVSMLEEPCRSAEMKRGAVMQKSFDPVHKRMAESLRGAINKRKREEKRGHPKRVTGMARAVRTYFRKIDTVDRSRYIVDESDIPLQTVVDGETVLVDVSMKLEVLRFLCKDSDANIRRWAALVYGNLAQKTDDKKERRRGRILMRRLIKGDDDEGVRAKAKQALKKIMPEKLIADAVPDSASVQK